MAFNLILAPEAMEDMDRATEYYEQARPGLGDELLSSLERSFAQILRQPLAHPELAEGYRRAVVQGFPYTILFKPFGNLIEIYAISHTSLDPQTWERRMK